MPKVKIVTPLTLGSAVIVAALAAVMMALEPEDFWMWLVVMLFLPVAILGLLIKARRANATLAPKVGGGLRASLVGAGVLLATALGFSVTDNLGLTGSEGQLTATPLMAALVAVVAVAVDMLGARLEHATQKETDTNKE